MTITLGSLFDGIGVFPLAASKCGITPVWASEIVPDAISITKRHFPEMEHLGDITKLDGRKIPAVHVITFGSPCQNLSSIGPRDGLTGAKSSLFYQAIRIIEEMRDASGGLYPAIAVWENVVGAMQKNLKADYLAVLRSFTGTEIPMPDSGHWADAGVVRGRRCDLAWRVMDAQYWARPRLAHRERVFVVADFTGHRAAEILFNTRPMHADSRICGAGGGGSPPKIIEALLLKQGGKYPLSCHFTDSKCAELLQTVTGGNSFGVLENAQVSFPLY